MAKPRPRPQTPSKPNAGGSGGSSRPRPGTGGGGAPNPQDPNRPLNPGWRPVLDQIGVPASQNLTNAQLQAVIQHAGGLPRGQKATLKTIGQVLSKYDSAYWQQWMASKGMGGSAAGGSKPSPGGARKPQGAGSKPQGGTGQAGGRRGGGAKPPANEDALRKRLLALGVPKKDVDAIPAADLQFQVSELEAATKKQSARQGQSAQAVRAQAVKREELLERSRQRNKGKGAGVVDTADEGSVGTDSSGQPVESKKKASKNSGSGTQQKYDPADDPDAPFFYNPFGTHRDARGRERPNIGRAAVQYGTVPAAMGVGAIVGGRLLYNYFNQPQQMGRDEVDRYMEDAIRSRMWMRENFGDPGQAPNIVVPQEESADMPARPEDMIRRLRSQP